MFSIKSPENQVNCIYGVIRPLYLIGRLIGFFPFSVNIQLNGKNSRVYFTLIDFIVFVVHVSLYAFFTYVNVAHNFLENHSASPLLILGTRSLLIFGIANGIACISADLCNRFKIFKIFHQCQHFDDQMKSLGSRLDYKQNRLFLTRYLLAWVGVSALFFLSSYWNYSTLYELNVLVFIFPSYFFLNGIYGSLMSIYFFFLCSVKSRYRLLNENLSRLTIDTMHIKIVTTSKRYTIEHLMRLADLHDLLNDILEMVNQCYSIQVMLSVGMSFIYMVFCLFSGYRGWIMRTVDEHKQLNMATVLIMWAFFYNGFVVVLMWSGHSTRYEGKYTGILLHRAINKNTNPEIVGRLLAFSQQLNHRVPDANCNLFSFDWTLLYSTVAAAATYLIILIQFDASGYYPSETSNTPNNVSSMSN